MNIYGKKTFKSILNAIKMERFIKTLMAHNIDCKECMYKLCIFSKHYFIDNCKGLHHATD